MAAGHGKEKIELFINKNEPLASEFFPVNANANPSRMSIGQERDAIEHPGKESFDGEIARFLIYERPLSGSEMTRVINHLNNKYGIKTD